MLTFVIMVGAVLLPFLFGGILALVTSRLDTVVTEVKEEIENKDKGYNTGLTLGHRVKITNDADEQIKQARILSAKKAVSIPRGANMRIGRLGQPALKTAGQALKEDPWSIAKIAKFHGWDGAQSGAPTGDPAAAPVAAAAPMAATGKIKLVPGKDYEYIEITDAMAPDEKRKARIANSKAKSAAMKAAKAAGVTGTVPAAVPVAAAPAAAVAAPAAAPIPTDIPKPNYVEITDDMSPDDKRKTRIANSKEKSRYNKALKAAGIDPKAVAAGAATVPAAAPAPAPVETAAAPQPAAPAASGGAAAAAGIPKPEYVELTDDMSPDEKRQARISNSKARSAYNKALKAAGIDPKSVTS